MKAFVIFIKERTLDEQQMRLYYKQVQATLADHPVRILSLNGIHKELEGIQSEGVVIMEFPSTATAMNWYESEEYRRVRQHRWKGADFRVILVQGT